MQGGLGCAAKAVTKPAGLDACLARNDARLAAALAKAGGCADADVATDVGDCIATLAAALPVSPCDCCTFTKLSFTTGIPDGSDCGGVQDDSGNAVLSLECGSLYFGGGQASVPLPALTADTLQSVTNVTSCDQISGLLVLGPTTAADTGSDRTCTSAGCLFGPPLPIPNPAATATSTCVVNVVAQDAGGTASCADGSVPNLSLPLAAGLYLAGDVLADAGHPGIQPCPLCEAGTCRGGPNDGLACVTGSSALSDAHPVSADCPPDPAQYLGSLPINFNLTTFVQSQTAEDTGALAGQDHVFCGFCATAGGTFEDPANACSADTDCPPTHPHCRQRNAGAFGTDSFALATARTITATGASAGPCLNDGGAHDATLASVFCVPSTQNPLVDNAADLPGPGAVTLKVGAQLLP